MTRKKARQAQTKNTQQTKHSTIDQHRLRGKTLVPPMADLPGLRMASWHDDRLPEMLWAALLVSHLKRESALSCFRNVAKLFDEPRVNDLPIDITFTGMAALPSDLRIKVLETIASQSGYRTILRPLLLLRGLPARESWVTILKDETPSQQDWELLQVAVAKTLYHQSQESTDCRWANLLCKAVAGQIRLLNEDMWKRITLYPTYGDIREVRPMIRAMEGGLNSASSDASNEWPRKFWAQCLSDTPCSSYSPALPDNAPKIGTTMGHIEQTKAYLILHCQRTTTTTATDPKHDTAFGCALYSLAILRELLTFGNSQTIAARVGLRTLVECYITLAYLFHKDSPDLWRSFRIYGAGQAKLQYLKLEEATVNSPAYVDVDTLKLLANEDMWEEFLKIDLGHWNNSDLRKMSIAAGAKETYDQYYGGTSSFVHGHWGAIREVVFDTCANPLHRLHRIPHEQIRSLPDLIPDACSVVDLILDLLGKCYPQFDHRVTIL